MYVLVCLSYSIIHIFIYIYSMLYITLYYIKYNNKFKKKKKRNVHQMIKTLLVQYVSTIIYDHLHRVQNVNYCI